MTDNTTAKDSGRVKISRDVEAYLMQAALELAEDLELSSEAEFRRWFGDNFVVIVERARNIQRELLKKVKTSERKKAVSSIISAKVWEEINIRKIRKKANTATAHAIH